MAQTPGCTARCRSQEDSTWDQVKRLNKKQICVMVDYFSIKLGLEERKAKEESHVGSWTLVPFQGERGFLSSMRVLSGMEGHLEVVCDFSNHFLSLSKQGKEPTRTRTKESTIKQW